jgi:hypothetical protein
MPEHKGTPLGQESVMSQCDQFRQYAEEALLRASKSKDEPDIKAQMGLAHIWTLAAFESERAKVAG